MPPPDDDPIIEKHRAQMNAIASVLDEIFNKDDEDKKYGFALLVLDFKTGGTMNYISNAHRDDMVKAMKEFINRQVGRN